MSEARFYCPDLAGESIRLTGDEARHAVVVRRLKPKDELTLFDGQGTLARAVIESIGRRGEDVGMRVLERQVEAPPERTLHVACALPKGDRQQVLLDMATQLGMTHFTPLLCEHGVAQPTEAAAARAARIVLEACKQSRRAYVPVINSPSTPGDITHAAVKRGEQVVIADPHGEPLARDSAKAVTMLVGPEAGFTPQELAEAVSAGAVKVALGAHILRIETAVVAMLGAISICRG